MIGSKLMIVFVIANLLASLLFHYSYFMPKKNKEYWKLTLKIFFQGIYRCWIQSKKLQAHVIILYFSFRKVRTCWEPTWLRISESHNRPDLLSFLRNRDFPDFSKMGKSSSLFLLMWMLFLPSLGKSLISLILRYTAWRCVLPNFRPVGFQ